MDETCLRRQSAIGGEAPRRRIPRRHAVLIADFLHQQIGNRRRPRRALPTFASGAYSRTSKVMPTSPISFGRAVAPLMNGLNSPSKPFARSML